MGKRNIIEVFLSDCLLKKLIPLSPGPGLKAMVSIWRVQLFCPTGHVPAAAELFDTPLFLVRLPPQGMIHVENDQLQLILSTQGNQSAEQSN